MGKGKVKKGTQGPLPLSPLPPDKLAKVKAPKPKHRVREKEQTVSLVGDSEVLIEYTCQWEHCDLPDKKFTRPRRGGRAPLYCCDAHRSAANAANRSAGSPSSKPRAASKNGTERELFEFLFSEVTMQTTKNNSQVIIPHQVLVVPDRLVPALLNALRRQHEEP